MEVDEHLFTIAETIAAEHTNPRWFEGQRRALVRMIKLRTAIYAALVRVAKVENGGGNG